jgi:hypothetical protein
MPPSGGPRASLAARPKLQAPGADDPTAAAAWRALFWAESARTSSSVSMLKRMATTSRVVTSLRGAALMAAAAARRRYAPRCRRWGLGAGARPLLPPPPARGWSTACSCADALLFGPAETKRRCGGVSGPARCTAAGAQRLRRRRWRLHALRGCRSAGAFRPAATTTVASKQLFGPLAPPAEAAACLCPHSRRWSGTPAVVSPQYCSLLNNWEVINLRHLILWS